MQDVQRANPGNAEASSAVSTDVPPSQPSQSTTTCLGLKATKSSFTDSSDKQEPPIIGLYGVSMDGGLPELIKSGCSPRQILLPTTVEPRLTEDQCPTAMLDNATFNSIFRLSFFHATHEASAKLLMTPMRDASNSDHGPRKAHREVGYYLANEHLGEFVSVETYKIKHVKGVEVDKYRVRDEKATLILSLMRDGEPMAFSVSKALKQAAFAHLKVFKDIHEAYFERKKTIILADSVVNSDKSILEYLEPLQKKFPELSIVVIAGIVQVEPVENVEEVPTASALRPSPCSFTFPSLSRTTGSHQLLPLR